MAFAVLLTSIAFILVAIIVLKLHPFLALILAAILVGLLSPRPLLEGEVESARRQLERELREGVESGALSRVSSVNYPSRSATTRIPVTYLLIFLRYIAAKWQCPLRGRAGGSGRLKKMRSILVRSRRRGHGAGGADRGSSK